MSDQINESNNKILRLYGEPFLRYVLALADNEQVLQGMDTADPAVIEILDDAIKRFEGNDGDEFQTKYRVRTGFTTYRADLKGSLANHVRLMSGGCLPDLPKCDDPLTSAIQKIAFDIWPSLLFSVESSGPFALWMNSKINSMMHPLAIDTYAQFMSDENLAQLFPDSPGTEELTDLASAVNVSANWQSSTGIGGTRQLVTLIEDIIVNASILLQLKGGALTQEGIIDSIPESVAVIRSLAANKIVDVPVVVGLAGVELPDNMKLEFGDDVLRQVLPVDRRVLFSNAARVTCVLVTRFPLKVLSISPHLGGQEADEQFRSWDNFNSRIEEAHRSLQKRINKIRLSILLASTGEEYLATSEVSRYLVDPSQPGGSSNWQDGPRAPETYVITEDQGREILRLHALINEKHPASLDIAMKRILGAVSERWDAIDAFIDAVVVWENAFGTKAETQFRVTGAIAKLLEPSSLDKRFELQNELKNLYGSRSRLVHGAKEPKPEEAWSQREHAISIAIRVLRELYTTRPDLLEIDSDRRSAMLLLEG